MCARRGRYVDVDVDVDVDGAEVVAAGGVAVGVVAVFCGLGGFPVVMAVISIVEYLSGFCLHTALRNQSINQYLARPVDVDVGHSPHPAIITVTVLQRRAGSLQPHGSRSRSGGGVYSEQGETGVWNVEAAAELCANKTGTGGGLSELLGRVSVRDIRFDMSQGLNCCRRMWRLKHRAVGPLFNLLGRSRIAARRE